MAPPKGNLFVSALSQQLLHRTDGLPGDGGHFLRRGLAAGILRPLPAVAAVPVALVPALPVTRWLSRGIARIIPRDETNVLSQAEFIGLVGTVTIGPLDQGNPGAVRVKDRHDNIHTLRAKAAPGHRIETGTLVLIVDGSNGLFQAIPAPQELGAVDSKEG